MSNFKDDVWEFIKMNSSKPFNLTLAFGLAIILGWHPLYVLFWTKVQDNLRHDINFSILAILAAVLLFIIMTSNVKSKKDKIKLKVENSTLLKDNFDAQETLARYQFDKDRASLGEPPDPIALKGFYISEIKRIVDKATSGPISMYDLKYYERPFLYADFCDLYTGIDMKVVHDRFYERYPDLKPDGYETIDWNKYVDENKLKRKLSQIHDWTDDIGPLKKR